MEKHWNPSVTQILSQNSPTLRKPLYCELETVEGSVVTDQNWLLSQLY